MNDLERKLTEFLNDDAADAHRPAQLPGGVTKSIRRRQVRTASVTGAATLAIIAVSIAGFRAFLPVAADEQIPAGPGTGRSVSGPRIASLTFAQIEVPYGWWLTDLSNVPALPGIVPRHSLVLTNYPPDLSANQGPVACGAGGYESASDLPDGGAAVVIGQGAAPPQVIADQTQPGSPTLVPSPISCARQLTAWWGHTDASDPTAAGPAWISYWAVATLGPNAPDPSVMQDALDSLKYPGEYPAPPEQRSATRLPQLWIAQGNDPQPWTMTAYGADRTNGDTYLEMTLDSGGTLGPARVGFEVPGFGAVGETDGGTLYGTVAADATEIVVEYPDGSEIRGQLFPVPSSLWGPAQAFVLPAGDAVDQGDLVARDATGTVIGNLPLSNGGATGDSLYGPWSLTPGLTNAVGSPATAVPLQLHIDRGSFDIGQPLSDPGATLIDPQALMLGNITGDAKDGSYKAGELVFGSISSDVSRVEFRSDDNGQVIQAQIFRLSGTEGGWRAFGMVTDASSGVVIAYDTSGEVLEQYALEPFVNADDPADFAFIVAEGSQSGISWRMVVPDPADPSCIGIDTLTSGEFYHGGCEQVSGEGMQPFGPIIQSDIDLVYGAVAPGEGVDVTTADGTTTHATVVPCPCGPIVKTDFFYAELPPGSADGELSIRNTPSAAG